MPNAYVFKLLSIGLLTALIFGCTPTELNNTPTESNKNNGASKENENKVSVEAEKLKIGENKTIKDEQARRLEEEQKKQDERDWYIWEIGELKGDINKAFSEAELGSDMYIQGDHVGARERFVNAMLFSDAAYHQATSIYTPDDFKTGHRLFLKGLEASKEAFDMTLDAIDLQNPLLVSQARDKLKEAKLYFEEFNKAYAEYTGDEYFD